MPRLKVTVCGARGKMGSEAVKAVWEDPETELVGAVDIAGVGEDIGPAAAGKNLNVTVSGNLGEAIETCRPDVVVDFTTPASVMENLTICLEKNIPPVVGTTGLTEADFEQVKILTEKHSTGAIIVPNFALGAVLMMRFARMAARFFPRAEIIELHHDGKVDSPSGTAIKTAEMMSKEKEGENSCGYKTSREKDYLEKVPGARGGNAQGIHIHSVRLPGLVAHQEVILGGEGQTLTIKHDSLNRRSFMPGLLLAVKKAPRVKGMVYGLEHLLDLD